MKWFRLYAEIVDDPKIKNLSSAQRWSMVELFCVACENSLEGIIPLNSSQIAWRLRKTKKEVDRTIEALTKLGIVSQNHEGFVINNWTKRQFKSDNVTSRTRAHKERSGERSQERLGEQARTEQIQIQIQNIPPIIPPLKLGQFKNVKLSQEEFDKLKDKFGEQDTQARIESLSEYIASKGKKYKSHYATILTWSRKEPKNEYQEFLARHGDA